MNLDVSKYNCDTTALESLPFDKEFNLTGGGRKQSGRKQRRSKSARKQSGRKQSGRKQSGRKQSGRKQSARKQSGRKQSGRKQRRSGRKQSARKQSARKQSGRKQSGGGFFLDISADRIGGSAKVVGYNSQPELIDGKMVKSPMDEKMCGGGKNRVNHLNKVNHLRSNNTGRRNKQIRRKHTKKNLKSRVFYRKVGGGSETNTNGGGETNTNGGSETNTNTNGESADSVFTDDMTQREFGCRQPNWEVKCT